MTNSTNSAQTHLHANNLLFIYIKNANDDTDLSNKLRVYEIIRCAKADKPSLNVHTDWISVESICYDENYSKMFC